MLRSIVVPTAAPQDPARERLAVAIAEAERAQRAVDDGRDVIARAKEMVAGAEVRHAAAVASVVSTKRSAASRLASAAASGSGGGLDRSIREARAEEIDAADAVEVARAALASVEAATAEAEYALGQSRKRVTEAARTVIAGAVPQAVGDVERLKAELNAAIGRLWFLHHTVFDWPPSNESKAVERHLQPPALRIGADNPVVGPWREAFEALRRDPAAPLPAAD